ncbi:MAG: helix-turn-helix domain-containing protein [Prevotella sp.]|jgi:AraC-like DNA-binding protein
MASTENSICQLNRLADTKTLHPQVSVINLTGKLNFNPERLDCYSVLLRPHLDRPQQGWNRCDFTDALLLAQAPNVSLDSLFSDESPQGGRLLLFHRDLLAFHTLGRHISDYTYLKYKPQEAVFLSKIEMAVVNDMFNNIDRELRSGIDAYSCTILSDHIKLLLDYIQRFYLRQFITREDLNNSKMAELNQTLDQYMLSGYFRRYGIPCASRLAPALGLSTAYLNDLVIHTTGLNMTDYVQQRRLQMAKQLLISQHYSDARIAVVLGYGNADNFRQLFKKLTGVETSNYR